MIFQGGRLKKKSTETFHTAQRGAGMSPVPCGLRGAGLRATRPPPAAGSSQAGRWGGGGEGPGLRAPPGPDRTAGSTGPAEKAPHEGTGMRWVQPCLQAETGLTVNPELLDCLAPLPLVLLLSVFWLLEQFTQHGFL